MTSSFVSLPGSRATPRWPGRTVSPERCLRRPPELQRAHEPAASVSDSGRRCGRCGTGPACVGSPDAPSDTQARGAALSWGLLADGSAGGSADGTPTVLVLVDGLGLELLRERLGHAPTLRSWLSGSRAGPGPAALTCAPSTTAAALTTLGTGALPGVTGMVGYSVLNPLLRRDMPEGTAPHPEQNLCLITWEGHAPNPRSWQDVPTIFERLERDQVIPIPRASVARHWP